MQGELAQKNVTEEDRYTRSLAHASRVTVCDWSLWLLRRAGKNTDQGRNVQQILCCLWLPRKDAIWLLN